MEREETAAKTGQILLTEQEISTHLEELARRIQKAYADLDEVTVVVLLSGAKHFADRLFALIDNDKFRLTYVKVSSYGDGFISSGSVDIKGLDKSALADKEILIVDDIYDSGLTMSRVVDVVSFAGPRSIRTCVLLAKQTEHTKQVNIDFQAAAVDDCFVVGFGLDYKGQYRDLPFIARLEIDNSRLSESI
jgi:hypoxanthine phosphoribosyltransferase